MTGIIAATSDLGAGQEQEVVYRIDAYGRLTFVNMGWDAFAVENGAPELVGAALLGRPITDFIDGSETKMIYDLLVKRAAAGASVTLPYRCDAPGTRRRMTLTMAACAPDGIEFRSRIVNLEWREGVAVLERGARRDVAQFLTICSWCNRGRAGGQWQEIEAVVVSLGLFEEAVPQLTHGMCPDCLQMIIGDCQL